MVGSPPLIRAWRNLFSFSRVKIRSAASPGLKNSPGFDKNNWPDFAEVDWQDAKRQFYGSDWRNEDIDRDQDIDRDVA